MKVKNESLIPLFNKLKKIMVNYSSYFTVIDGDGS